MQNLLDKPAHAFGRRAFTLFEALAVLALIALMASLAAVDFGFLDSMSVRPVETVLKNAVRQAKAAADSAGKERALYFDAEGMQFVLRDFESAAVVAKMPLYPKAENAAGGKKQEESEMTDSDEPKNAAPPVKIVFEPVIPEAENSFESSFGTLDEIPCLRFYPDGASSECIIKISTGGGPERRFRLDPFSEVPVEIKE